MDNKEKILDKIKKCLALSQSANENESATALRQAQALMAKYDLTVSDVELSDIHSVEINMPTAAMKDYRTNLSILIAECFGCLSLVQQKKQWQSFNGKYKTTIKLIYIGAKDKIQLIEYVFDVLSHQITQARKAYLKTLPADLSNQQKQSLANDFCFGFVASLDNLVQKFANPEEVEIAIEKYAAEKYDYITHDDEKARRKRIRTLDENAFLAGSEQGQNATLHKAMNSNQGEQKLLAA